MRLVSLQQKKTFLGAGIISICDISKNNLTDWIRNFYSQESQHWAIYTVDTPEALVDSSSRSLPNLRTKGLPTSANRVWHLQLVSISLSLLLPLLSPLSLFLSLSLSHTHKHTHHFLQITLTGSTEWTHIIQGEDRGRG